MAEISLLEFVREEGIRKVKMRWVRICLVAAVGKGGVNAKNKKDSGLKMLRKKKKNANA